MTANVDLLDIEVLAAAARELLAVCCRDLVIDASRITFLDSVGLGLLVELAASARERGGHLRLEQPSDVVRQVVRLTGLGELLGVQPEQRTWW